MSDTSDFEPAVTSPAASNGAVHDELLSVEDLRKLILEVDDIDCELLALPEWKGVRVEIRGMTGDQRATYMETINKASGGDNTKIAWKSINPALLRSTVFKPAFDNDGKWLPGISKALLFETLSDEQINSKASAVLEKIGAVSTRLSGIGQPAAVTEDEDTPAAG